MQPRLGSTLNFLRLCQATATNRESRNLTLPWLASLLPHRDPLQDGVPWLPYSVTRWLSANLTSNMSVLEFGAGGSTVFFSGLTRSVFSVEHDSSWCRRVLDVIRGLGRINVSVMLREPDDLRFVNNPEAHHDEYLSSNPLYRGMTFYNYVHTVDLCRDESFDLVVLDGRARLACLRRSLPKLRNGGFVLLDDSERSRYRNASRILAGWSRQDFSGLCPYTRFNRQATVWQKPQFS